MGARVLRNAPQRSSVELDSSGSVRLARAVRPGLGGFDGRVKPRNELPHLGTIEMVHPVWAVDVLPPRLDDVKLDAAVGQPYCCALSSA